jgi:hypothetical protein
LPDRLADARPMAEILTHASSSADDAPPAPDALHVRARRQFTVLLPIHRPPAFLPNAVASVLRQSVRDLELCIICDGAPPETAACARALAATDPRLSVFDCAKGERNGEAHRARVLESARSEFVAQIADDDLWFPDHLKRLAHRLQRADFVALRQIAVLPTGELWAEEFGDLGDPHTRTRMLEQLWNFFGPTVAGYRLSAYRSLPVGWSPAPAGLYSDLYMWRKFLAQPNLRLRSGVEVTSLKFTAELWAGVPAAAQAEAMAGYARRMADPALRAGLRWSARRAFLSSIDMKTALGLLLEFPMSAAPLVAQKAILATRRRIAALVRP